MLKILFLHGENDDQVPSNQSKALFNILHAKSPSNVDQNYLANISHDETAIYKKAIFWLNIVKNN